MVARWEAGEFVSITLARTAPTDYRVTYWNDGIARYDGFSGARQGAWSATVPPSWVKRLSKTANGVGAYEDSPSTVMTTALVVETQTEQFELRADPNDEPPQFWRASTLLDGVVLRTAWVPFDVTGADNFATWADGVPLWFSAGEVNAAAIANAGGILVLAGSWASASTHDGLTDTYQSTRLGLLEDDSLTLDGDRYRLTRHIRFDTPSAAATVLAGSNVNGRRAWRSRLGRTWADLDLDRLRNDD